MGFIAQGVFVSLSALQYVLKTTVRITHPVHRPQGPVTPGEWGRSLRLVPAIPNVKRYRWRDGGDGHLVAAQYHMLITAQTCLYRHQGRRARTTK